MSAKLVSVDNEVVLTGPPYSFTDCTATEEEYWGGDGSICAKKVTYVNSALSENRCPDEQYYYPDDNTCKCNTLNHVVNPDTLQCEQSGCDITENNVALTTSLMIKTSGVGDATITEAECQTISNELITSTFSTITDETKSLGCIKDPLLKYIRTGTIVVLISTIDTLIHFIWWWNRIIGLIHPEFTQRFNLSYRTFHSIPWSPFQIYFIRFSQHRRKSLPMQCMH